MRYMKVTRSSLLSGFSLVELLVVIAVIAIIAAIAVPNIANITQTSDMAMRVRNAQILVAVYNNYAEAYYAENNDYPDPTPTAAEAISLLGGTNQATVINNRLGTTNVFSAPGLTTNNVAMNKISSSGGQLSYNPDA